MARLSIGQLAVLADMNASALRYYESVGLLPNAERVNGQRRYSGDVLDRIRFIKIAQQTGFTIQEIAGLVEGFDSGAAPSARWRNMAEAKREQLEERKRQIDAMLRILDKGLGCSCLTWSECSDNINAQGI